MPLTLAGQAFLVSHLRRYFPVLHTGLLERCEASEPGGLGQAYEIHSFLDGVGQPRYRGSVQDAELWAEISTGPVA